MASIANDGNGRKRIQFVAGDGSRKAIRLGKVSQRQAETFAGYVEKLMAEKITGAAVDAEVSRWVAGLDDDTHGKLAAVGLVKSRELTQLGPWLERYIDSRTDLKSKSRTMLHYTRRALLEQFPATSGLRAITPNDTAEWRVKLMGSGLSEATIKVHVGNAKWLFNEAKRRALIPASPFEHLSGGATAAKNDRYITPDETDKIIAACPDIQFKVLFALARLAGLRTHSETSLLTWGDVDWDRGRLNVRSPKTEHHAGHERRVVPIVPKLMKLLQDAFAAAPEGQAYILTLGKGGYTQRTMIAAVKRSGVEQWPRLWQALRSSCEKEWAMTFPQYAVSKWIGHSIAVSGKHYANSVPDELFDGAADIDGSGQDSAAQNAAQHTSEAPGNSKKPENEEMQNRSEIPGDPALVEVGVTRFELATSWSRTKRSKPS